MPIIEYKCTYCQKVFEKIHLNQNIPCVAQCECTGIGFQMISTPAQIKMTDMVKKNRRVQRIKEPMWRDLKTGKLEPVNP